MKHKFNFTIAAKLARNGGDDLREIVSDYRRLYEEADALEATMITYREKCVKLRHENEFMLKLIDKYMQEHCHETDT